MLEEGSPRPEKPGKGAPRKKGEGFQLYEQFKTREGEFTDEILTLYGEDTQCRTLEVDCLWGRGYYRPMRFVLVETYRETDRDKVKETDKVVERLPGMDRDTDTDTETGKGKGKGKEKDTVMVLDRRFYRN